MRYLLKDINSSFAHSAVYKITNNITGHVYIGQTCNLRNRIQSYINLKQINKYLKAAILEFGLDNFYFEVVSTNIDYLREMECLFIQKYRSYNRIYGYNIHAKKQYLLTDEIRNNVKAKYKGKIVETKKRINKEIKQW